MWSRFRLFIHLPKTGPLKVPCENSPWPRFAIHARQNHRPCGEGFGVLGFDPYGILKYRLSFRETGLPASVNKESSTWEISVA
jgi:hypothetical protein